MTCHSCILYILKWVPLKPSNKPVSGFALDSGSNMCSVMQVALQIHAYITFYLNRLLSIL